MGLVPDFLSDGRVRSFLTRPWVGGLTKPSVQTRPEVDCTVSNENNGKKKPIEILQEFSIPLILGVVTALVFANVDHHAYHELIHTKILGLVNLHFVSNDIVMVFFFGIATKEIVEACLPGGALNPARKAINPLAGTLGGILGPVGVYFLMAHLLGAPEIRNGWGIPTATDIALAWLIARIVFGKKHPAVSFLLLLAVADDAVGLGIIAVFYPDPQNPVELVWLLLIAMAVVVAYKMRKEDVQNFLYYLLFPGVLSWIGFHEAHLHPALALVVIVPFMPSADKDKGIFAAGESEEGKDTLNRFEHFFKLPVDLGLFLFALANAGVAFTSMGAATTTVLVALIVGKTVGIFTFSSIAHVLGFKLPDGMNFRTLFVSGVVASLGLTVALFVAGVAFTDPQLQGAAKMGALLSVLAVPIAIGLGRVLRIKRIVTDQPGKSPEVVSSPPREPSAACIAE